MTATTALLIGLFCGLGFVAVSALLYVAAAIMAGHWDDNRDVHDTRPAWMSDFNMPEFDGEVEGS